VKGKVKEFSVDRGCGTIVDSASGRQLIVYANNINLKAGEVLNNGAEVTYDIENKRHEIWAVNVEIL
jgi:cold shock CspA family protein